MGFHDLFHCLGKTISTPLLFFKTQLFFFARGKKLKNQFLKTDLSNNLRFSGGGGIPLKISKYRL